MNLRALPFKKSVAALSLTFCFMMSFTSYSQTNPFYQVKGTVINGLQLKSIQLMLLDNQGRAINAANSDSLGRFTFTGLRTGTYKLVNKYYGLDTILLIQDRSVEDLTILLNVCEVDALQAQQDILQGKARLLLIGGIAPTYYAGQETFEKKYKVSYHEYGCTPPDKKCVKAYNNAIFTYLDKKYGRKWHKEVRKDVVGYK